MLNLRATQKELQRHKKIHEQIAERSRRILRSQADLLCQALNTLKRRSDAGQETATRIWNSLIEGITSEIPRKFFEDYARNFYYIPDEELNENDLAFRDLLYEAAARRSAPGQAVENGASKSASKYPSSCPGPHCHGKGCSEAKDSTEERSELLVENLVGMLKVAGQRTELSLWDWKEEDESLKREIGRFNKSLKMVMELFTEIHENPDMTTFFDFDKPRQRGTAKATQRTECQSSSYDSSEDRDDDDEDGLASLDSSITEVDYEMGRKYGKCCKTKHLKARSEMDDEGYIVRHAKKPKGYSSVHCDHVGYVFPTSHYRDWKRDGFRCMCGQKFRFLNLMDRHILVQQEARMLSCDRCDYRVNRRCCLDKHKRDVHEKPKMLRACRRLYQCMFGCEIVLKSKKELFRHQHETERQCKFLNALPMPAKPLPSTPLDFADVLKTTCDNSNIKLTAETLEAILNAAEKDVDRITSEL